MQFDFRFGESSYALHRLLFDICSFSQSLNYYSLVISHCLVTIKLSFKLRKTSTTVAMKLRLYAPIILGLASHSLAQNARAVGTLFQVDFTTNAGGGCQYVGQAAMQNILQDSLDLLTVGTQLVTDYGNNVAEARRLLDSFFQVETPPMSVTQLHTLGTTINGVRTWILNGGAVNNGQVTGTPYLFCYHNWLQKQTMSSPAFDTVGETYPNVYTGTEILLNQEQMYITKQQQETAALPGSTKAVPYWSPKHKGYIFDRGYAAGLNAGPCTGNGYLGVTQHSLNPSSITLCPMAFGAGSNANTPANLATAHYVGRRSVAANAVPRASVPTGTGNNNFQKLSALTPTAITLLHEMFHLVLGNDATYAAVGEVYDLFTAGTSVQVVGLDYDYAVANPESYALAAVAYDYTLVNVANAAGQRVEFYSGYTTQG